MVSSTSLINFAPFLQFYLDWKDPKRLRHFARGQSLWQSFGAIREVVFSASGLQFAVYALGLMDKTHETSCRIIILYCDLQVIDDYTITMEEAEQIVFGIVDRFREKDIIEPTENEYCAWCRKRVFVPIGRHWLGGPERGQRLIDQHNDFVRLEIAAALKRGIRVIPILLPGAVMPTAEELPAAPSRPGPENRACIRAASNNTCHMPALANPRHEKFAQAVAFGKSAYEAY